MYVVNSIAIYCYNQQFTLSKIFINILFVAFCDNVVASENINWQYVRDEIDKFEILLVLQTAVDYRVLPQFFTARS